MSPRDFALIAQEAYSAAPDIGIEDSASRAILRDTPEGLIIAFPGTNNIPSWIADLDIALENVPGVGNIHRGFWRAWTAIQTEVLEAIAGKPVIFVGHSLGAAIAIMAAVATTIGGNPPVAVYGFEPPRISPDLNVRTLLASIPVHLYKNGNDIVPDVPPLWQHAALLNRIGKPILPIPNIPDHYLQNVIPALPQ